MSHLSDIGFDFKQPSDLIGFVEQVVNLEANERIYTPDGYYIVWSPGHGIEIWIHADPALQLTGCTLHFAGEGRLRASVTQTLRYDDSPMRGSVYAWLDPEVEDNPYTGITPFVVDVPDFNYMELPALTHQKVELQATLFAEGEALFFETEQKLLAALGAAERESQWFRAAWEIDPQSPDPGPSVEVGGRIVQTLKVDNPHTGKPFWWALVATTGGTIDLVVDPEIVQGEPILGGYVSVHGWLTARVASELPPPPFRLHTPPTFRARREARLRRQRDQSSV